MVHIALFIGLSHLQSLYEGEALEIWSCAVMSATQRVDTWGGITRQRISKPFLLMSIQGLEARVLVRQQ